MRDKLIELLRAGEREFEKECRKHFECKECSCFIFGYSPNCLDALTADYLIANGVTIQRWIPVEERLPEPEQDVLVSCKQGEFKYQCTAFYIPPKWDAEESFFSWDSECLEYSEENDGYYVKSGWYERIHNWDEYNAVGIADKVTHWMPLPEPPKEEV